MALTATLSESDGSIISSVTLTPWFLFWDIAFFENLFYVWPHEQYDDMGHEVSEAWSHCNYQGWWYKMSTFYVDVAVSQRECTVGTYDYFMDDGTWTCSGVGVYSVSKVMAKKIKPWAAKEYGMYDWGFNSCVEGDFVNFDARPGQVRSLLDSLKGHKEEA